MRSMALLVYVLFILGLKALTAYGDNCIIKNDLSGTISDNLNAVKNEKCWIIHVPKDSYISLDVEQLRFERVGHNGLEISVDKTGDKHIFDGLNETYQVTARSDVRITHYARNQQHVWWSEFRIKYKIEKGLFPIEGLEDSLDQGTSWLMNQRTPSWGWRENTPRAVVALFLASAVNFNGTNLEEELMAKETELTISFPLLRSTVSISELSMYINAMLVTCHNPRKFHGIDLVRRLKTQVEMSLNFTHPVAYLALCNANDTWPLKAVDDLESVLSSNSEYPFVEEIQAMAVMALSCVFNRNESPFIKNVTSTLYQNTIERFKTLQLNDGSFGNIHTTALITQALLASDGDFTESWKLKSSMKYLMEQLNSTSMKFLPTYLTLPIFNWKTLVDISKINCSNNHRKQDDDIESDANDYLGAKMRVRYSLYIGDKKDVIHTLMLRVPVNFTAYEVMKLAEFENPKYKFEWKRRLGKIYVYEIADIENDSEVGKFWLQYVGSQNSTGELDHSTKSPDKLLLKNEEHLVMWYKTAHI